MENNSCPYKPRKVLTEKQAKKEKVGTFYHPTEKTFRSGACPIGYTLKKGYTRKSYNKKDGKHIVETNVDPTCVKNKGLPGKLLKEYKKIHINEKDSFKPFGYSTSNNSTKRHEALLKASKELSYKTVVHKLSALRTYRKDSEEEKDKKYYNIFNTDIKKLKEWRDENPDLYKNKSNNV